MNRLTKGLVGMGAIAALGGGGLKYFARNEADHVLQKAEATAIQEGSKVYMHSSTNLIQVTMMMNNTKEVLPQGGTRSILCVGDSQRETPYRIVKTVVGPLGEREFTVRRDEPGYAPLVPECEHAKQAYLRLTQNRTESP